MALPKSRPANTKVSPFQAAFSKVLQQGRDDRQPGKTLGPIASSAPGRVENKSLYNQANRLPTGAAGNYVAPQNSRPLNWGALIGRPAQEGRSGASGSFANPRVPPQFNVERAADQARWYTNPDAYEGVSPTTLQTLTGAGSPQRQRNERAVEQRQEAARGSIWGRIDILGRRLDADGRPILSRQENLSRVQELTQEQYDALTPGQQAAVQFNTGLVSAAGRDGEGSDYIRSFGDELGINVTDLDSFLGLNRAIDSHILRRLEETPNRLQVQNYLVDGERTPIRGNFRLDQARGDVRAASDALTNRLAMTGISGWAEGSTPRLGYGGDMSDMVVQQMYQNMIDSSFTLTRADLEQGLRATNAAAGTNVTMDDVTSFADALWGGISDVTSARSTPGDGETGPSGQPIQALSIAEIRQRYGL